MAPFDQKKEKEAWFLWTKTQKRKKYDSWLVRAFPPARSKGKGKKARITSKLVLKKDYPCQKEVDLK